MVFIIHPMNIFISVWYENALPAYSLDRAAARNRSLHANDKNKKIHKNLKFEIPVFFQGMAKDKPMTSLPTLAAFYI
jgi:hypothetical protein